MKSTVASKAARAFPIVVIGASAGGLEPLTQIAGELSPGFGGCVLIVMHVAAPSHLPEILQRAGVLPAEHANGQRVQPGRIFVAPPGVHLVIEKEHLRLSHGPKQNGSRPAIDPLFVSAARNFGPRVIGVVLSGALDDGSAGLAAIRNARGTAIVQLPADASSPEMPRNAMAATAVDYVLPGRRIGRKLNELIAAMASHPARAQASAKSFQLQPVAESGESDPQALPPGKITALTCPECGGALWEQREGRTLRFACHVGHTYSAQSMLVKQSASVEEALWVAMRSLKERSRLLLKMAHDARSRAHRESERHYQKEATEFARRAELLRRVLLDLPGAAKNEA